MRIVLANQSIVAGKMEHSDWTRDTELYFLFNQIDVFYNRPPLCQGSRNDRWKKFECEKSPERRNCNKNEKFST